MAEGRGTQNWACPQRKDQIWISWKEVDVFYTVPREGTVYPAQDVVNGLDEGLLGFPFSKLKYIFGTVDKGQNIPIYKGDSTFPKDVFCSASVQTFKWHHYALTYNLL